MIQLYTVIFAEHKYIVLRIMKQLTKMYLSDGTEFVTSSELT